MNIKFLRIVGLGFALAVAASAQAASVTYFGYGSAWPFRLGTNEASAPDPTTWRTNLDTTGWSLPVTTPIGYGDPVPVTIIPGSAATTPNWLCIFMRRTFVVANPAALANATLSINIDDGYVVWINGTEVGRFNVPAGALTIASAAVTAGEPVIQTHAISSAVLRAGTNVIAIQAFNANLTSSDLYVDANLVGTIDDVAPDILFQLPYAGSTLPSLTQIEVDFTEPVTGVNAADLLINGNPATNLTAASSSGYVFRFPQPPLGPVSVQFAPNHGIQDLAAAPNPFAGGSWTYILDTNVVVSEEIRLNELVAANVSGLRDEDNEPQDWVELKNLSTNFVSIAGWSLSDDEDTPDKWVFPAVTIGGGGYLVVFCSEKDRKPVAPGSKLHTNFKLSPDGEFLGLYNADVPRKLISSFNPYPNQRRDYSYGYDPAGQLRYFALPTPYSNNPPSSITGIVADVKFSVDRGFFTNGFSLSLTCATPGVTLRYTLDGKAPTTTVGSIYSAPLPVNNTTVLRAFAYKANFLPSDVDCQTYIFLSDVITQSANGAAPPGWPATWGGNTVDYGMDPEIVTNALYRDTIKDDLKSIPSFSIVMNLDDMFNAATGIYANPGGDGPAWERSCSIELIHPEGEKGFQANCGIRLRGGFSRSTTNPKHAFRFFFRQEYGLSKLNFPFFGATGAKSFDKFDMRTMQNYSWSFQNDSRMICVRDSMSRDAQLVMNGLGTRGDFYHLYINGQYWGLYNSEERPEAAYAESYIGGREEDYDTIKQLDGYISGATDGNNDAWFRLWYAATNGFANDVDYFKVQGLNVDGTVNTNYENLVDVPNLIDYMLVILYGGNLDAPISNFIGNDSPNNWYGFRDRTGQHGGFRFFSHDSEHTLLNVNEDRTGIVDLINSGGLYGVINPDWTCGNPLTQAQGVLGARDRSTPQYIWFRMHQNAEFRMLAADRIQKHCFNGGALSVEGMRPMFMARSNEIQRAIVGESARWGDAKNAVPYTRSSWISAMNAAMGFINGRTAVLISQLRADGLFPNVSAPSFNTRGGAVSNGFTLFITNNAAGSVVYYTLDGADPRVRGGNIASTSLAYTPGTPLVINFPTTVRARSRSGTTWSPITEATLYPAQDFSGLLITEIMFHPPQGDTLEFLELKNAGSSILDLSDIEFSEGFQFTFPYGTRLMPGQFYVLGRDRQALTNRYPGLTVDGLYTGHLDNAGENVVLKSAVGTKVLSVEYKDGGRWPISPDGFGYSLVPRNPNANPNPDNPTSWRASTNPGGSPGSDDPAPAIPAVVVNEALTHSDPPAVDYIELYNPTGAEVDLSGWFLTDDRAVPMKYRIPNGTTIPEGGYLVFNETNFNPTPGAYNSFSLSSQGESVYLISGDAATTNVTGYSHGFSFDAAPAGVTFGRHVISTGDERFALQSAPTPNAANSGPAVGPVGIRQFMYHPNDLPGGLDNQADEYIELRNITDSPVPLFDTALPTNTWRLRGGAEFNFPTNVTLGAHQSLLLVSFDPANPALLSAFRAKYGVFSSMPTYGPYSGKLDNSSDSLKIQRPDSPETNGVPYILVDGLDYQDAAPWPPGADGSGQALQRVSLTSYADDPANWIGTAPLTILGITPPGANVRAGTNAATAINVTFTVNAVGTGALTYQWRKQGVDLPGATNDSFSIADVQLEDQGNYSVRVSDQSGSAVSPNAYLGVFIVPYFLQAPLSQTVVRGQTVTFSAVIAGSPPPFTYTWKRNSVTIAAHVSSATTDYYTFVVTNAPGTYPWRVVITNSATADAGLVSGVSHSLVANMVVLADTDNDGVPDAWETANGFSPTNATDAALDADGDSMSNWEEYIAGTNPTNALSYLKLDASLGNGLVNLSFQALSNRTYAINFKDDLGSPSWTRLAEFPARNSDHIESVADPNSSTNRFYRLETPLSP
ncbi:MAG TPA: lamin tail domain-containing protein [Verrucomicrobiae bacterium]|nr:lamin tail domain-containing protein [Verrucomicrobiae bacterium]